ncbi:MAG TPA: hypothetical protein V6C69_03075 [Trichormus sp.]
MAISLGLLFTGAQAVRADQVTTVRQETVTTPTIIAPLPVIASPVASQVTTTTTTVAPEPVMKRTLIMSSRPVSSSSSVVLTAEQMRLNEDYSRRLSALRSQIDLGLRKGFISQREADRLFSEQSDLDCLEASVRSEGFPKFDSDSLEKRINLFNVKVSNILTDGMRTAGVGSFQ